MQRCERLSKHRPSIQYGNHDREERCLPRAAPDRCWIAAHFEALIVTESFLFGRHRWDSLSQTGTETAHSNWAIQRTAAFLTSIPNVMGTINQQTSWGAVIFTVAGKTLRLDALPETEPSGGPHRGGREEIRPAPSLILLVSGDSAELPLRSCDRRERIGRFRCRLVGFDFTLVISREWDRSI